MYYEAIPTPPHNSILIGKWKSTAFLGKRSIWKNKSSSIWCRKEALFVHFYNGWWNCKKEQCLKLVSWSILSKTEETLDWTLKNVCIYVYKFIYIGLIYNIYVDIHICLYLTTKWYFFAHVATASTEIETKESKVLHVLLFKF